MPNGLCIISNLISASFGAQLISKYEILLNFHQISLFLFYFLKKYLMMIRRWYFHNELTRNLIFFQIQHALGVNALLWHIRRKLLQHLKGQYFALNPVFRRAGGHRSREPRLVTGAGMLGMLLAMSIFRTEPHNYNFVLKNVWINTKCRFSATKHRRI